MGVWGWAIVDAVCRDVRIEDRAELLEHTLGVLRNSLPMAPRSAAVALLDHHYAALHPAISITEEEEEEKEARGEETCSEAQGSDSGLTFRRLTHVAAALTWRPGTGLAEVVRACYGRDVGPLPLVFTFTAAAHAFFCESESEKEAIEEG